MVETLEYGRSKPNIGFQSGWFHTFLYTLATMHLAQNTIPRDARFECREAYRSPAWKQVTDALRPWTHWLSRAHRMTVHFRFRVHMTRGLVDIVKPTIQMEFWTIAHDAGLLANERKWKFDQKAMKHICWDGLHVPKWGQWTTANLGNDILAALHLVLRDAMDGSNDEDIWWWSMI